MGPCPRFSAPPSIGEANLPGCRARAGIGRNGQAMQSPGTGPIARDRWSRSSTLGNAMVPVPLQRAKSIGDSDLPGCRARAGILGIGEIRCPEQLQPRQLQQSDKPILVFQFVSIPLPKFHWKRYWLLFISWLTRYVTVPPASFPMWMPGLKVLRSYRCLYWRTAMIMDIKKNNAQ